MKGRDEGGMALVVATVIGTVLLLASSTVVSVASRDILQTRRGEALLAARSAAEAALDALAARAAQDPGAVARAAAATAAWSSVDPYGRARPCTPAAVCSRLVVRSTEIEAGDTERRIRAAVAEATGRAGCRRAGRCVEVRLQQRLERRPGVDFLVQTDVELADPDLLPAGDDPGEAGHQRAHCERASDGRRLLARERPAGCVVPAWFGAGADVVDVVEGPVHTNDDLLLHCGSPRFVGPVETTAGEEPAGVAADVATTFFRADPASCGNGAPDVSAATLRTAPPIRLPPDVDHLEEIASDGHGLRFPLPGEAPTLEATVDLRPDGRLDVVRRDAGGGLRCACAAAGPDSGVLFVDAPVVRVRGRTPLPITIAVRGAVVVDGDLGTTPDTASTASIGIVAEGPVHIQVAGRTGSAGDRRLDRVVLVSLRHTVVTDPWDDPQVCADGCPTLHLTGAVVGRYRPLIGSYDVATGLLAGGYRKQLRWHPPLADHPPPYLLSPTRSAWRRADAVETGSGVPGLVGG